MSSACTYIEKFELTDFRNYENLSTLFDSGRVIFTGNNGSGKTNLLEAISFLAPGKGLRSASYAEVTRDIHACETFFIHAKINGPLGAAQIGTGVSPKGLSGESVRQTRINEATTKSMDALLEWLRILWLTPTMERLFIGSAADRRRFLDLLVLTVNTQHTRYLMHYEKAMKSRNRLLFDGSSDHNWFSALEMRMAETGTAIAAARVETVKLLSEKIATLPQNRAFPQTYLQVSGTLENMVLSLPAVEIEEKFLHSLAKGRERDRAAGRTLDGPHRSDLLVYHQSKKMPAELCSTGEQKALLISIILSHARLCAEISRIMPILLLDEIAAHLDYTRREELFCILEELGCQTFMTGTEPYLFSGLKGRAQFLTIYDGVLMPTPEFS